MSGSGAQSNNYSSPSFNVVYVTPQNVPPELRPYFNPIYIAFQNIIQLLITYAGIAPRNPAALLSSNNDTTSILANNVHRYYVQAAENIGQGAAINLYASVGQIFVRNAIATSAATKANGFCSQQGGIQAGAIGEVIVINGVASITGLIVGADYYLSTTPGQYTTVKPSAAGQIVQPLGIALTSTALLFEKGAVQQL